jgi:hypothetical protein
MTEDQVTQGPGGDPEATDQGTHPEEPVKPQHEWVYKNRLPIYDRMAEVVKLTIDVTKQQLESDRRKLRKLQYGS